MHHTEYWQKVTRWKVDGLCTSCGAQPEEGRRKCRECLDRYNRYETARARRRRAAGLCIACGERPISARSRSRCEDCLTKQRTADRRRGPAAVAKNAAYRRGIRAEVLAAYGARCACCGEAEEAFLTLDHVNGGGTAERRTLGRGTDAFYRRVRAAGFPPAYQVLCANCNMAKGTRGRCPHQTQER